MTFKVVPASLDGYAGLLDRAAGDTRDARDYTQKYADAKAAEGNLWAMAGPAHTRVVTSVTSAMEKAGRILEVSRGELTAAASYYRASDGAAVRRADGALTGICAPTGNRLAEEWATDGRAPSLRDAREPSGRLTPVDDVEYSHPLGFLDAISISHWALEAFNVVFGFNPLNKVLEYFGGDWERVAKTGVAVGRVGEAMHDLGYNLHGGAAALHADWTGNAADSAHAYFLALANGVADLQKPLGEMSKQLDYIAHGVWSACESVSGIIKGLVDAAIIAGIAFAAGTVTAETGVGAILGYGVAALEVANMLRLWGEATKVMMYIYAAVQAAAGIIEGLASQLINPKLPELPGGAGYDHPLAAA